jgi:PAS domain-containing protein
LARVRTHLELNRLRTDLEAQVAVRTAELLLSEAKLRSLFSAMSDVIFVLDRRGCCVEIASTRADRRYRPSAEWLGKDLAEILAVREAAW